MSITAETTDTTSFASSRSGSWCCVAAFRQPPPGEKCRISDFEFAALLSQCFVSIRFKLDSRGGSEDPHPSGDGCASKSGLRLDTFQTRFSRRIPQRGIRTPRPLSDLESRIGRAAPCRFEIPNSRYLNSRVLAWLRPPNGGCAHRPPMACALGSGLVGARMSRSNSTAMDFCSMVTETTRRVCPFSRMTRPR